jgi:cytochrome c peroxidase
MDAIAAYIAFGVRAPISRRRGADVSTGRALFAQANCQACHGGPSWTRSRIDFTPPPAGTDVTAGQLTRFLVDVGTFDPTAPNEFKANQASVGGANGGLGFNVPSLLSVFNSAPYLHSGHAETLDEVLDNVTHRSAGTGGVDTLGNPTDRQTLVLILESIDAATEPFE